MQNSENKHLPIDEVKTAYPPKKKNEHKKSEAAAGRKAYKETIRLFLKMLITIFLCEAAIMALLYIVPLKRGWEIVVDPLLLTILGTPILYWLLVRPVWLALEQRNGAVEILRESENRLKEAQRVGQVGDWEFDVETQEVTWSEEVYRLFGRDPAQGPPTYEENMAYYYPEDSKRLQEQVSKAIELGEEFDTDYQVKLPGGKTVYQRGLIRTVKDENGKVIKLFGTVQDITERKKTEKELKKQKYYLEKAQDIGRIGTWELDIEKNILVWTDENYQIFGVPKGTELTYEAFLDCVHPDDREYVDKKWKAAFDKEPYDIEHRLLVDGEIKWVREKAELEFDKKGNCVCGIGFTQDITDRKKAVEILRISERNLAESQKIANIGSWEMNILTNEEIWSDQIYRLLGFEPGEVSPCHEVFLRTVHPDDRGTVTRAIQKTISENKPYEAEFRVVRKDGTERIMNSRGEVNFDDAGKPVRLVGIGQDITERKQAEQKVIEDREQLKSLASQLSLTEERERRRIATELHDQIGQSLVFSKLKLDELHQSATSRELTKALDEICSNIGQIIQDTRTLTFDLSSPILNELGLEAAVADWLDVQIGAKHGIETKFEDDGQEKPLDDDIKALLFRNVRELLVNVIKHAQAQMVKVSIRRVNEHIHIEVEDDGKGFDSVKVISTAIEDTKFGLFSIRQRLEQLGGQFEIDSRERCGSKITMTSPLKVTKSKNHPQNS